MSSQHTSAPLEAIGCLVRTKLADGGFLVAEFRDCGGVSHTDEAKCNARLFVAADDLLEACKLAVSLLDSDGKNSCSPIVQAARAAIAKASGAAV